MHLCSFSFSWHNYVTSASLNYNSHLCACACIANVNNALTKWGGPYLRRDRLSCIIWPCCTCEASTRTFIRFLISLRKQIKTKRSVNTNTRVKIRDAIVSASSIKSTLTQAQAQTRCNFYSIEVGTNDLATTSYPGSLSFPSDDNGGKGEKR